MCWQVRHLDWRSAPSSRFVGRKLSRIWIHWVFAFILLTLAPALAHAQAAQTPRTGVLQWTITTQSTVRWPGAEVVVTDAADRKGATVLSGEDGTFTGVAL